MKDEVFAINIEDFPIGRGVTKFVEFPSFYGLNQAQAPIYVLRATEEISPCVVVTAAVHGDEISGIGVVQSLINSKSKLKKGTLIIVPVINIYGFQNKVRYLPDRRDLNRCFPGSDKGSFGSRFASFVLETITKYGDYFIDLHSGTPGRFNVPQVRCDINNPELAKIIPHLSIPLIVNSSVRDGSLRNALTEKGKVSFVFEGGEGLRIDRIVTKYGVNLVKSLLVHLEMMSTKKVYRKEKAIIKRTKWIRASEGGIFNNKAIQGKVVRKGEVIGELRKITGELITKIKIEKDGVILGLTLSSLKMSGDPLYNIGFFEANSDEEDELLDFYDFEME